MYLFHYVIDQVKKAQVLGALYSKNIKGVEGKLIKVFLNFLPITFKVKSSKIWHKLQKIP